jgi:hypothetical protein
MNEQPEPEEEDQNGWSTGYVYLNPEYLPGEHPVEKGEVTWIHLWPPMPKK